MKKDPVRIVGGITIIWGVTCVSLVIINIIEKEQLPGWIIGLMGLLVSMYAVSEAFKHIAKRIDELEKKLKASESEAS